MSEQTKEILKSITTNVKKLDTAKQNYVAGYVDALANAKEEKKAEKKA